MDTNNQRPGWACIWLVWGALMVVLIGASVAKSNDEGMNVMAYWERKLNVGMPSSIQAMVPSLSSEQVAQLLIKSRYLPNDAVSFCKVAHIQCVQQQVIPPQQRAHLHVFRKENEPSQNLIPFYQSEGHSDSENVIPFYQSEGKSNSENVIPFYQSEGESHFDNLIPLYQSKGHADFENLIPFYQSEDQSHSENLIPFYQSDEKGLGKPACQQANFKQGPRSLLLPTIEKIGWGFREKQVLLSGLKIYIDVANDKRNGVHERAFLPRQLARMFPLDNEGSKIARMLGIPKESVMKTIQHCEAENKNDNQHVDVKACLTSLEDVVDFVSNIMGSGKPIKVYDALFNPSTYKFTGKTFIVTNVETIKQDLDAPSISCHETKFPFQLFYCHYVKNTKSFVVTLQAEDGSTHERIANCHYDTSYWNPHHIVFQELQFSPGEAEVCHWLSRNWMEADGWLFLHA